jgi:dihydroorotate dehydrogenase
MIWKFITFFVRKLDPENAHKVTLLALKHGLHPRLKKIKIKIKIKDLEFLNPLGVAAGFDKNAEVIEKIHSLNFGFSEVGTVTPFSQYGNPKPRVFRLEEDKAIINRNGFNNLGMSKAKKQLEKYRKKKPVGSEFLVGVNIGPNKDSLDRYNDYEILSENLTEFADYITINISSPNTPNLREQHEESKIIKLIDSVKKIREEKNSKVPIFFKISPDISDVEINNLSAVFLEKNIDGLILTNTTIKNKNKLLSKYKEESGGLSGLPLNDYSNIAIQKFYKKLGDKIPIIGAGGINNGKSAFDKIKSGASLLQLYTSLVYEGPYVANKINKELSNIIEKNGYRNISEIIGLDCK